MILKKLILSGFKSFADRTEFTFDRGITCIVGPNGCGKSNVVDAVKWVVGEQSAKSLRGGQMLDMIFNGSATRTSSSMAQVELVFDNSDGSLNVDHTEVTIARRLYRSGDSAYLLNKEPCRLKDVRELLLDTGVGLNAYSVIEQGRVDQMLRANPQERRAIFEEAAGVSKYKARRKEAERKLGRTQQNLLRLQDLVDELDQRLRRVKTQASKARRYQEYDIRLRELRAGFAMAEFHRLTTTLEAQASERTTSTDQRVQHQAELASLETTSSQMNVEALELDREIENQTTRQSEMRAQISAFEERARAAERRRLEVAEAVEAARGRADREQHRVATQTDNLNQVSGQLPELSAALERSAEDIRERTERERGLARRIAELESRSEDERSGLLDLLRESSELHNEIAGLGHHHETLKEKKDRLQSRDEEIRSLLTNLVDRKTTAQRRLDAVDTLIQREDHQLQSKLARASELTTRVAATSEQLAAQKAERSGLASEQGLLQDLEARMEGVDQAVRDLLNRKTAEPDNPQLAAIHGMVADAFATDVAHSGIVEAALERWSQHLIVRDSEAFLALNGELQDLRGRLQLLCLDRLPAVVGVPMVEGQPGLVRRALDLVKFPEELETLSQHLLGRTFVVETREQAMTLARRDTRGCEFVTHTGERVSANGELVMGSRKTRTGLISRKSRLREVGSALTELDDSIAGLSGSLNRQQAESAHLDHVLQQLRDSMAQNHTDRAQTQAALEHALEDIARLTREQPMIASEAEGIEAQLVAAHEQATARQVTLDDLNVRNTQQEQSIAEYGVQLEQLNAERDAFVEELTEARIAAGQLAEKKSGLESEIQSIRAAVEAATRARQEVIDQIADGQRKISESEQDALDASARSKTLKEHLLALDSETLQLRHQREELRERGEQLSLETKALRSRLSDLDESLHALEMKIQESTVRREELTTRIAEELGVELEEAYARYEHEQQDWAAVEEEIQTLRQKIDRLGSINVEAIAEQAELEERLEFLSNQRGDLDESRRQLEELIETLNNESRDRFDQVFKEIRTQFQTMFRKLFGGGKADLVMDPNAEDVLEAGIDVVARPPGKELQSIMLMSGGEKTMTAIALLLSIFKSKPSPYVFLDEVDAALDEANNERFNNVVMEFLDDSQFIIITHSKRTMHVADTLYGVTMQEPGCSRLVSVGFEDSEADREPAVA
jgi:chromosome segregation protein